MAQTPLDRAVAFATEVSKRSLEEAGKLRIEIVLSSTLGPVDVTVSRAASALVADDMRVLLDAADKNNGLVSFSTLGVCDVKFA